MPSACKNYTAGHNVGPLATLLKGQPLPDITAPIKPFMTCGVFT